MVITKMVLPRRTFLRGMGATLALPFLDAMVPAMSARAPGTSRFAAIYVGNGMNMFDWIPPTEGVGFELSPILQPLEPFRKVLTDVIGDLRRKRHFESMVANPPAHRVLGIRDDRGP